MMSYMHIFFPFYREDFKTWKTNLLDVEFQEQKIEMFFSTLVSIMRLGVRE